MPGISARRRHPRLESDRDERPMGDRRSVPGPTLAVKPGEVTLYRFPNHIPLCWNATWRTDCRTVIYKQRRRQHGPGRDRVPRGIRLHGGRPGQDRQPERQGRRLRLVPLMGSRIRPGVHQGRAIDPVIRRRPCALAHVFAKTPVISHSTGNEQNICSLLSLLQIDFRAENTGFPGRTARVFKRRPCGNG